LGLWVWLKPRGLDGLLESVSLKNVNEFYKFVDESVIRRRGEEENLQRSGADESQGRKDMFHYLFKTTDDAGNPAYSVDELNAEANLLIIGGSDTTSTIMSGFWFYLTRHPRVYDKLVEEIRTTFKSADDIKTGPALISCKYLHACVDESLRLSPAETSELAREVLPGGLDIAGHHIPEGTHVGVAIWTFMHNQEFCGDPWVYRPERWTQTL
jgi:cytochrome P450